MELKFFLDKLPNRLLPDGSYEVADYARLPAAPMVSVVMMTYNHAAYVSEAIDGVLRQNTTFPIELIIGEDCSSDSTRVIIREYFQKHPDLIRIIVSDCNVGYLNALRIEYASRGKYLAYCDGDDYWHDPDKLEQQIRFLEENSDYSLVHTRRHTLDLRNVLHLSTQKEKGESCRGWIFEDLLYANFMSTCTVCVRASLIKEFAETELGRKPYLTGDWPRWLYASRKGKIEFFDEAMSTYRLSQGSATRSGTKARLRMKLNQREIQRDFIREYEVDAGLRETIETSRNSKLLELAMQANDRVVFMNEFRWMIKYHKKYLLNIRHLAHLILFISGIDLFARQFSKCLLKERKRDS